MNIKPFSSAWHAVIEHFAKEVVCVGVQLQLRAVGRAGVPWATASCYHQAPELRGLHELRDVLRGLSPSDRHAALRQLRGEICRVREERSVSACAQDYVARVQKREALKAA